METRKIVKSGNTSYILALPIAWVRRNNLESGKLVQVTENEQGDLVIGAEKKRLAPKGDIVTIKVDRKSDQAIYLEFLTAYLRDARSIIFEGKEIVQKTGKILEHITFFIGLDVIEQSTNNIIVKNFFSLDAETSPHMLLRKMDIINRAGFELLKQFAEKGFAQEDFSELRKLHDQNERLFILIRKSTLKLFEYPSLMHTIQTTHLQNSKEKIFARALMDITSLQTAFGKTFLFLDRTSKEIKNFMTLFKETYDLYLSLLNAVYNKNSEEIARLVQEFPQHTDYLDKYLKSIQDPLTIQAALSLIMLYHQFQIIAQEALL